VSEKLGLLLANAYVIFHVVGLAWALWRLACSLAAG
jgi:hypothetical protein